MENVCRLEDLVKFCFLAKNKKTNLEDLMGPISTTVLYKGQKTTVVTAITAEDIRRFVSDEFFKYA